VTFNWFYGAYPSSSSIVYAYPNIEYIHQFISGTTISPTNEVFTPVANFTSLTATHSISFSGNTAGVDTAFDLFLMNPTIQTQISARHFPKLN
jgi:hypothetical protein